MRPVLHLDFETYSDLDVRVVGAYRYAEHPSTEILVAGYALNDQPVRQWEPHLYDRPPADLLASLEDPDVLICAHNAEFERRIIVNCMGLNLPRTRYRCTAVRAAAAGLPRALDGALAALGHVVRKDPRGKALLRRFASPRKPTKNDPRTRIHPADDPEKWPQLLEYNKQDVVAEHALDKAIPDLPPREWRYYQYVCKLNDRGLPLDLAALKGAAAMTRKLEQATVREVTKITGYKPTQVAKIQEWLSRKGVTIPNLQLKTIQVALREQQMPPEARTVLLARMEASKASTKKIKAMQSVVCDDGRAHGTVLPYGAHTGRLAGRLIQPHNFPRGLLDAATQNVVLDLFTQGDIDLIRMLLWHRPEPTPSGVQPMQGPMSMLAQSMRGFIRAPQGYRFIIVDYAAVEARILAWLANEAKLLIAYRNKVDTYKMMASDLYKIPIEEVNKEQRRIGKNLRLGAGYQLGPPKLVEHCAKEEIFIDLPFAVKAIRAFRDTNRNIVRSWYALEDAAIRAMQTNGPVRALKDRDLFFEKWRDWLLMELPSGRRLHYYAPSVDTVVKFGKPKLQLSYFGERKAGMRGRVSTYGGKLVENAVQSIARDIMMEGMLAGEEAGYPALVNIHDEDLTLRKIGEGDVKELERVVCKMPKWAAGIPLAAEGFECERYRKG